MNPEPGTVLAERPFGDDRQATVAVVRTVATVSDTSMRELPPLESVVDTDCLDHIFDDRSSSGAVLFDYCGYLVCVHAAGYVSVHESRER